ncbi:penicillin-insensitive murein endopeptidase [Falsirhodobacter sp. alg1]|uniref:penicillin-insensitive murein endopeptidase n=1 Tax=Falsirhodobacter sp. alg1 TaxID=1472418 RepID=UPI0005EF992C|nr:penicillin-insensitive murein endopeptidase [Falsirhodobacter sp. alg1]
MIRPLAAIATILSLALPAGAEPLANQLFGAMPSPSAQRSEPVGFYSRGCGAGMVQLPETGPTWQAMRLSRNRNWGQPEMITFLEQLSVAATKLGWRGLYIGDISQPRGGPMTSGHASHQIGLDADVWMLPPSSLTLSRAQRESISSISIRTADQRSVNSNWTPQHQALLQSAAMDDRVDRIFVAAAVKIRMCQTATAADTPWLQKIRPIAGHNTHFHIRLKCPAGSRNCTPQTPTVNELSKGGNGCDETLSWWVTDYLNPQSAPAGPAVPASPSPRTFTMADLPAQCTDVLRAR